MDQLQPTRRKFRATIKDLEFRSCSLESQIRQLRESWRKTCSINQVMKARLNQQLLCISQLRIRYPLPQEIRALQNDVLDCRSKRRKQLALLKLELQSSKQRRSKFTNSSPRA